RVNTVARTDPPIGSRAVHGTQIVLYLSKGPAPRVVPEVAGQSREDAKAALESRRLVVRLRVANDENAPPGQAIRTDPKAGSTVPRGARVILFISNGPAPRTIPDLAGRSRDDAAAALQALQLDVIEATPEFSNTVPADAVIRTEPAAGHR